MNKRDAKIAKAKILKCLTQDFTYGRTKSGAPLKRPRRNVAIFDAKQGFANFTRTDLEMVMDAVVRGLYFAIEDSEES